MLSSCEQGKLHEERGGILKDKARVITLVLFLAGYAVFLLTGVSSTGHLIDNLVAGYLLGWGMYVFLSDLPRKEIRARFILTTVVCMAILCLAEIMGALGMVNYQALLGTSGRAWWDRPGYVRDPELVYRHAPYHSERGSFVRGNIGEALCLPPGSPKEFDLRYDRNGFRNDEDMDRADVVVIGDSYVESSMLPSTDLLTTTLAARLERPVANLGVTGYGPEQELVVLKRYALALQPKTLIWVFFEGNDLLQLDQQDVISEKVLSDAVSLPEDYWVRSLTRNVLVASKNAAQECVPHRTFLQFRGNFQKDDGRGIELFFWEKPAPLESQGRLRLERLRAILDEAHELCRQRGIRFIVAFAPVSYRVHQGLERFEPSTPEMQDWPLNDLPDEIEPILRTISPDIEFVDLTLPLREAAARGVLTYLPDDTHWTADGQYVVGQVLHQHVTATAPRSAPGANVPGNDLSPGRGGGLHRL